MNIHLKYALAGISLLALGACDGGGASTAPDIAGTGKKVIRGPVTGFGSVIVDGVRYDSDDAQIEIDDQPGDLADLQIGQIVMLEARGTAATMVRYEAEMEGPVDSVDVANDRFTALGIDVLIEGTTVFRNTTLDTLAPGDFVEVSGEFDASGELHAAFVEREDSPQSAVEIKGTVAALDAAMQRFQLGALVIDYSSATLDPSSLVLANGQFVEVEGQLNNGVLQATEVEREDRDDDFETGDDAQLEGFVSQVLSSNEFVLSGVTVRYSAATEFEDGSASDIALNVHLEVEGRVDANGVLIADEIEFDDDERRALRFEFEAPVQSTTATSISLLGITLQTRQDTVVRDDRDENNALRVEESSLVTMSKSAPIGRTAC